MFHGTSNLILGLYLTSSKFENKELSILGSFYLHEVLEELKTYFFFFLQIFTSKGFFVL